MYLKTCQIDEIISNLNITVDAHYEWLVNILEHLINKGMDSTEIVSADAHKSCRIGRWLMEHQPFNLEEADYMRVICETHQQMHDCGRQLIQSVVNKRDENIDFSHFKKSLLAFSSAVTSYKDFLIKMRNGIDILTGLPGRRVLEESFAQQLSIPGEKNLYLLLLDIDHFKHVNDEWGHLVGDSVLRGVAQQLRDQFRDRDMAYRYGGEEFIVLLQARSDKEACRAGLRLCRYVAGHTIRYDDKEIHITITAGITRAHAGESLQVVADRADTAMYHGKQTGRNRCMFMDEHRHMIHITS